jgi:hypothetical protein
MRKDVPGRVDLPTYFLSPGGGQEMWSGDVQERLQKYPTNQNDRSKSPKFDLGYKIINSQCSASEFSFTL